MSMQNMHWYTTYYVCMATIAKKKMLFDAKGERERGIQSGRREEKKARKRRIPPQASNSILMEWNKYDNNKKWRRKWICAALACYLGEQARSEVKRTIAALNSSHMANNFVFPPFQQYTILLAIKKLQSIKNPKQQNTKQPKWICSGNQNGSESSGNLMRC